MCNTAGERRAHPDLVEEFENVWCIGDRESVSPTDIRRGILRVGRRWWRLTFDYIGKCVTEVQSLDHWFERSGVRRIVQDVPIVTSMVIPS